MKTHLNFNSKSILDKTFSVEWKGYNADEVDNFFDRVKQDYMIFEDLINNSSSDRDAYLEQITSLKKQNDDLRIHIDVLKKENERLKNNSLDIDSAVRIRKVNKDK